MGRPLMVSGLALVAGLTLADPVRADATIGGKVIECFCTDRTGSRVELGQTICLYVDGRAFLAQCQMSLNNPMWRDLGQGCVSSGLLKRLQRPEPAAHAPGVDAPV